MIDDAALAADLATRAGTLLLDIRANGGDPAAIGAAGDRAADDFLLAALRAARPDDGLLSEETKCDGARLNKSRVWIVDPVDGTREYGEGRDDWAVHVGLAIDGMARVGAVALPALGITLDSATPPAPRPANHPPRFLVSRTRAAPACLATAQALGAETVAMGSAGAKAMAVVRGEADIYLHCGGQHEWDNCAPAAVAAAAGLHVSRADGSPLRYNRRDPSLPDLLICRPELATRVIAAFAAAQR